MESFSDPKIAKHATFVTPDGFVKGGRMLEPLRRSLVDNDHLSRVTFHRDKVFKQAVNAAITTFDNTTKHDYVDKNIVNEDGSVEKSTLDWKYRSVIVNEDKEQIQALFENKVAAKSNNMSVLVTNGSYFGLKTACFRSYEYKFMDCPDNRHFMKMLVGAAKKGKNKKDFYWVCPEDTFQRNEGNIKSESIHLRDSDKWKVAFTEAGTVDKTPAKTWILGNGVIYTGKYLGILVHDKRQAINANKYFTTNFYRAGIASKMTGWDKFASWHSLVPIQDFSNDSDIDWSGSLKSIDEQLYRKYGFTDEDIATIDRFITPAPGYSDPFAYADPRIERNDFASPSLYTVSDTLGDTADGGSVVGEAGVPLGGDVDEDVVSDEDVSVDGDVDTVDGGERVE